MNYISKTHQSFSERLRNPRVLENPEEFLGQNFEAVLNFWLILDELSEEELNTVEERYEAFFNENRSEWIKTANLAIDASKKVVGFYYAHHASRAALGVTMSCATCRATLELIALHLILEQKRPLNFTNFFLNLL